MPGSAAHDASNLDLGPKDPTYHPKTNLKECFDCLSTMSLHKFSSSKFAFLCHGCQAILNINSKGILDISPPPELTPENQKYCQRCREKTGQTQKKVLLKLKSGGDFPLWLGNDYLACVHPNCDSDLVGKFSFYRPGRNSRNIMAPQIYRPPTMVSAPSSRRPNTNTTNPTPTNDRFRNFGSTGFQVQSNDNDFDGITSECSCNKSAKKLQVQKDGPNKGRFFYTCAGNRDCDFFEWVEDSNSTNVNGSQSSKTKSSKSRSTSKSKTKPKENKSKSILKKSRQSEPSTSNCSCNVPAIQLTVKKDGPNKNRQFFTCSSKTCNYFEWADGMIASSGTTGNANNSQCGSNKSSNRKAPTCGQCGVVGHTKRGCPLLKK